MKARPLHLALVSCLGLALVFALAFPRAVEALVLAFATAVWLMLRLFVLSIDQEVYWWGLISLAVIFILGILALRFRAQGQSMTDQAHGSEQRRDRADYWRSSILLNVHSAGEWDTFRRELMWLFTSMHSSRRKGKENYKIREAIQSREIPVPETVYSFFFPALPAPPEPPYWRHPIAWLKYGLGRLHRRPGGKKSRYFGSIDGVLSYLESSLEIKHDE
jgi:hypothetical protein